MRRPTAAGLDGGNLVCRGRADRGAGALIAASALVLARAADHNRTRVNPLWMFFAAALLGLAGFV